MTKNDMYSPVNRNVIKYPTLNEREFYEVYLTLANLGKEKEQQLSSKAILLLSAYMTMPLDFLFEFRKKKFQDNEPKNSSAAVGETVGLTPSYTWYLMKELRDKKALIVDEDKLIRTNPELTKLRQGTKIMLAKYPVMQFEWVFQANIVEDDETNESNIPTSSQEYGRVGGTSEGSN